MNNLTYKWITGILITVVTLMVAAWATQVQSAVSKVGPMEERISSINEKIERTDTNVQRIAESLGVQVVK